MRTSWITLSILSLLFLQGCPNSNPQSEKLPTDVILHTKLGKIGVHLYKDTPGHRANFLDLCTNGFFDSLTFHRVIHNFVVQSGDPRSKRATWSDSVMGPGYRIDAEFTEHHVHVRGALSMARKPDDENPERQSSGSQFFFVTGKPVSPHVIDSMENVATGIRRGKALASYYQEKADSTFTGSFNEYLANHPIESFRYPPEVRKCYLDIGGIPHLDFIYTVFGEVTSGMETVMRISRQPSQGEGQLLNDIRIDSVTILPR